MNLLLEGPLKKDTVIQYLHNTHNEFHKAAADSIISTDGDSSAFTQSPIQYRHLCGGRCAAGQVHSALQSLRKHLRVSITMIFNLLRGRGNKGRSAGRWFQNSESKLRDRSSSPSTKCTDNFEQKSSEDSRLQYPFKNPRGRE